MKDNLYKFNHEMFFVCLNCNLFFISAPWLAALMLALAVIITNLANLVFLISIKSEASRLCLRLHSSHC